VTGPTPPFQKADEATRLQAAGSRAATEFVALVHRSAVAADPDALPGAPNPEILPEAVRRPGCA